MEISSYRFSFCLMFGLFLLTVMSPSIFAKSERFGINPEKQKYRYIQPKTIKNFVSELNELGKQGYKLKIVERIPGLSLPEKHYEIEIAGIVELHGGDTFEYESFQSLTLADFVKQVSTIGEFGFYFCNRIGYSVWKDPYENLPEVTAEKGTTERDDQSIKQSVELIRRLLSQEPIDGSIFIFERKNKAIKPVRFKFATAIPVVSIWGTNVLDASKNIKTIESSLREIDTITYRPVAAFYSSAVFKTQVSHLPVILFQDDLSDNFDEKPVYRVLETYQFASKFRKQVDVAAKDGFALKVLQRNFAIVYETKKKFSYHWLEPSKKDFTQKLEALSKNGGRFFANETLFASTGIVFEEPQIDDGERYEYLVLTLTEKPQFRSPRNPIDAFEELISQGFLPRSIYFQKGMNVILERRLISQ